MSKKVTVFKLVLMPFGSEPIKFCHYIYWWICQVATMNRVNVIINNLKVWRITFGGSFCFSLFPTICLYLNRRRTHRSWINKCNLSQFFFDCLFRWEISLFKSKQQSFPHGLQTPLKWWVLIKIYSRPRQSSPEMMNGPQRHTLVHCKLTRAR